MIHFADPGFWELYRELPIEVRKIADKNFDLLKKDPHHPSLHLKKTSNYYSVRIGLHYRALAMQIPEGLLWFWIGSHSDYDRL